MCSGKWITPFIKQCFVTAGVTLNVMSHGVVLGYTTDLLVELETDPDMPVGEDVATWIASAPELALVFSTLLVPLVIRKCGRRVTNLISAIIITAAWFGFVVCSNITTIIVLRVLKGFSLGFTGFLGAVMIGEYTTPKLRGAFLSTVSVSIFFGIFVGQALGTILSWKESAAVYAAIGLVNIIVIFLSPETPTFLAFQHRYEECKKVFRWLRGFDEEEELEKMIKASKEMEEVKSFEKRIQNCNLKQKMSNILNVLKKKEFKKTILWMLSLYMWNTWAGCVAVYTYANIFYQGILGLDINFPLMLISVSLQTVVSNIIGIIIYRYFKRRKIFLICTLSMVFIMIITGLYVYLKTYNLLPFHNPYVGAVLVHLQSFVNAALMAPFPNVLMGEITPLRYREVCGTISLLFCSANIAIILKTAPLLISTIGLHGAYFLYSSIVCIGFILPWLQLPETKDRTLQDIEDDIRGEPYIKGDSSRPLSNDADTIEHDC